MLSLSACKGGKHAPQTDTSAQGSGSNNMQGGSQKTGGANAGPTYVNDIKPLFEKNCLPCHDKGSALGNWLDYKTVFFKKALIKNRIFEKKDMPLGKSLPENQRALVAKWIDMGAVEGAFEESEVPQEISSEPVAEAPAEAPSDFNPETLTYVKDIKPFFEKYCSTCHNENSGPVMPNWLLYDIAVLKKDALLDRVIAKKNMPLEGMPAPSPEERDMLNLWIQKGMKYEIK